MEAKYLILGIGLLFIIGWCLLRYLNSCPHSWKVIQRYEITKKPHNQFTGYIPIGAEMKDKIVGYAHVKECEYCKTLKKETINL